MITVKNNQRSLQIRGERIKKIVQELLTVLRYADFDVGILLTSNKTMRHYNNLYRNKNEPTDILSFGYHEEHDPKKRIKPETEEDKNLGDLILSLEYIKNDAQKKGVSLEERLKVLLVHGICHLLGYDHETDADWRSMRAKEAFLLKKIKHLTIF